MKCFAFLLLAASMASAQVASPAEAGMYVQTGSGFTKIIGQIAQFTRTGSRLASTATVGIKSAKANIQLQGPHAQTVVSPQPTFYFIPPKQAAEAGVNAGDLILIRLEEKPHRRQFEVAAAGLFRASAGISLTHQIQLIRSEAKPGVYIVSPAMELQRGEYALYLARGEGMAAYVYDFGVQGAAGVVQTLQPSRTEHTSEATSSNAIPVEAHESFTGTPNRPPTSGNSEATISPRGSLGVLGSNWQEQSAKGVEIVNVLDGSCAEIAGLHKGEVITDINGKRISSTNDLASFLSQSEPGTRVTIGYLHKSNIGWMPKTAVAILSREE